MSDHGRSVCRKGAIALLFAISAWWAFGVAGAGDSYPVIQTGKASGVILPAQEAIVFDGSITGRWTPDTATVQRAERCANIYFAESRDSKAAQIRRDLADYKRQYIGVLREGRRVVLMNFFRGVPEAFPNWCSHYVWVFDGGRNFFRLEYDVDHNQCGRLKVNNDA